MLKGGTTNELPEFPKEKLQFTVSLEVSGFTHWGCSLRVAGKQSPIESAIIDRGVGATTIC